MSIPLRGDVGRYLYANVSRATPTRTCLKHARQNRVPFRPQRDRAQMRSVASFNVEVGDIHKRGNLIIYSNFSRDVKGKYSQLRAYNFPCGQHFGVLLKPTR